MPQLETYMKRLDNREKVHVLAIVKGGHVVKNYYYSQEWGRKFLEVTIASHVKYLRSLWL